MHVGSTRHAGDNVLRSALESGDPNSSLAAARLLEFIGERSDIATLRGYAKASSTLIGRRRSWQGTREANC